MKRRYLSFRSLEHGALFTAGAYGGTFLRGFPETNRNINVRKHSSMLACLHIRLGLILSLLMFCTKVLSAQVLPQNPSKSVASPESTRIVNPKIVDGPDVIDINLFMPAELTQRVTVEFKDSSLDDVVKWLTEKQKMNVVLDRKALSYIGVDVEDNFTDHLNNKPLFLLLDRLQSLDLVWKYEDETIFITSPEEAEEQLTSISYNIDMLLRAGYKREALIETITGVVAPGTWKAVGGLGSVSILGDKMFVRQTNDVHRETRRLFAALQKHGRYTIFSNPPQSLLLKKIFSKSISISFQDTPLDDAVIELARKTNLDIRIHKRGLEDVGLGEKTRISISVVDRDLKSVLRAMLIPLDLDWFLRNDIIWIVPQEERCEVVYDAIFDVRDLCRNTRETKAIIELIISQAAPTSWGEAGGPGWIFAPRSGTLIIRNSEEAQNEVLKLLEARRKTLDS